MEGFFSISYYHRHFCGRNKKIPDEYWKLLQNPGKELFREPKSWKKIKSHGSLFTCFQTEIVNPGYNKNCIGSLFRKILTTYLHHAFIKKELFLCVYIPNHLQ